MWKSLCRGWSKQAPQLLQRPSCRVLLPCPRASKLCAASCMVSIPRCLPGLCSLNQLQVHCLRHSLLALSWDACWPPIAPLIQIYSPCMQACCRRVVIAAHISGSVEGSTHLQRWWVASVGVWLGTPWVKEACAGREQGQAPHNNHNKKWNLNVI